MPMSVVTFALYLLGAGLMVTVLFLVRKCTVIGTTTVKSIISNWSKKKVDSRR